ncbi:hypothetical protein F5Y11DRAFT_364387 [Daldinia sp. FL1419]|nr:hypothetical protein F5Y11DRAFT_364387 [Daldinia sp. FL1419]
MAQEGNDHFDDEMISLYFDIDAASCPPDADSSHDSSQYYNDFDKYVAGSTATSKNGHGGSTLNSGQSMEQNFSGGFGCYVWPNSHDVMMGSKGPPAREVLPFLRLRDIAKRKFKEAMDPKYIDTDNVYPSRHAGIQWKKLTLGYLGFTVEEDSN